MSTVARSSVTRKRARNGRWMHFRDGRLISEAEYNRAKGRSSGARKTTSRSRATTTRSKTMPAKKTRRRAAPRTKEVAGFHLGWQPDYHKMAEGAVAGVIIGGVRQYGSAKLGAWTEPVALGVAGAVTGNDTLQTLGGVAAARTLVTALPGGASPAQAAGAGTGV